MTRATTSGVFAIIVLLCGACGGGDDGGGAAAAAQGALRCAAGELRQCPCAASSGLGTQTCSALGNSFGPCTGCPAPTGTAGQTGAAGTGVAGSAGAAAGTGGAPATGTAGTGGVGQSGAGGQAGAAPDAGPGDAATAMDADTEPSGGAGTQPGVSCGVGLPALCALESEKCCTRSLSVDTCIAADATCDCEFSDCQVMEVHCDGPEDCPSGQVCCGTLANTGAAYQDFQCAAQCQATGNQRVACHQDAPVCPANLECENSQLLTNIQVCIDPATIQQ